MLLPLYTAGMQKTALLALLCVILAACGVKPRAVDPPDGQPNQYPRTYPNPAEP